MNWLITSSANPENISLAVKGVAIYILPVFIALAPSIGLTGLDMDSGNAIIDAIVKFIDISGTLIATGLTFVGLMRKIRLGRWAHPEA